MERKIENDFVESMRGRRELAVRMMTTHGHLLIGKRPYQRFRVFQRLLSPQSGYDWRSHA